MSRSLPGSPKARSEEDLAQERRADVQKLLDDWHYTVTHNKLAQTWGRTRILAPLLEVLELHGMPMPASGKEALLKMEEHDLVWYLADSMPLGLRDHFVSVSEQLLTVVLKLTEVRQSIEAGNADQVVSAFEGQDVAQTTMDCVLRQTIDNAAGEVARIKKCHSSWRHTTEARIGRLQSATEEAENASKALLVAEARIESFRSKQSEKARACLMGLITASREATMATYFASWRGAAEEGKVEMDLRNQYEAQIEEMQKQFLKYQETRLENVRNAMTRLAREGGEVSMSQVFKAWCNDVEQARKLGDGEKQLDQMKQQLANAQADKSRCAMKVVASMVGDSIMGPIVLCWHGWVQFSLEYKKNKDTEDKIKALELKMKASMEEKKDKMAHVLSLMGESQDEDLVFEIMQCWAHHTQEEKRKAELDDAMRKANQKLSMLKDRQLFAAHGVRGRMNRQLELICMSRHLLAWMTQTKVVRVENHYSRKLDTKRKQLMGVQTLFQTFASQIEANLDVEDDDDSKRTHRSSRDVKGREKKSKGHDKGGLQKGAPGTVSLPDIHSRPGIAAA